jgi:hypothetical protein
MPLIQGDLFTYEGSKGLGRRSMRGGPRIETKFTQALEEQLASFEVLNIEKIWVKFNKNMIVTGELIYRNDISLYFRKM